MNSQNPKDWKDWQRVLYYWRYSQGHSGVTINLLAHICQRPVKVLLSELRKDPRAYWGLCGYHQATMFSWLPWSSGVVVTRRALLIGPELRKWPPEKFISIHVGEGERGPRLKSKDSIMTLRAVAAGKVNLYVSKERAGYVWV